MIAGLGLAICANGFGIRLAFLRIGDRLLDAAHDMSCDFYFRVARSARKIFDGMAVVIPGGKIHVGKVGVLAENFGSSYGTCCR